MTDISINNNSNLFENGDFIKVSDIEELKQSVVIALHTFYNEWVLDSEYGIDYFNGVKDIGLLETDIRKQLISIKTIKSVENFNIYFDRKEKCIKVSAGLNSDLGKLYIEDTYAI